MKRLLFFGELPPNTIHGASISNQINLEMLKKLYIVDIIEEKSILRYHNKFALHKLFNFLSSLLKLIFNVLHKKHAIFYSVIYLSTFGILKNIITVFIVKCFNKQAKVYIHFHRSDFNIFINKNSNRKFFKVLDQYVDLFIVLTEKQKEELIYINQQKIIVLHNTIEIEYEYNDFKSLDNIDEQKIKVTYIGNFIKEKGVLELVESLKKINEICPNIFSLEMYGNFSTDETKNLLENSVQNQNHIKINSAITGKDKFQIIFNSDILVLPSYNEGLPIILLECISVGKPIIISNVGYVEQVLKKNYEFYCEPKNVNSIIENLIKFKESRTNKLYNLNTRKYYQKFSRNIHEKELLNIFNYSL